MILTQQYLQSEAQKRNINEYSKKRVLNESLQLFSKSKENYDLFISHSYLDKKLVLTLVDLFSKAGYFIYVDWIDDTELDRSNVTENTAKFIKSRIRQCKGLSYISTANSTSSKWCPWELGIADGMLNEKVCILPVMKQGESYNGQEYLGLYSYIEYEKRTSDSKYDFWVHDSTDRNKYVILSSWLKGEKPFIHK